MQIASEQSTESADESSLEVITSLDRVEINDCKNNELTCETTQRARSSKFRVNMLEACCASKIYESIEPKSRVIGPWPSNTKTSVIAPKASINSNSLKVHSCH